jgi:hypothetical protein
MRVLLLAVVACAAGCLRTSAPADEFGADAPADEFTAEQAKALIPEAAGIPWNEFRKYSVGDSFPGNIRPPNGEPLTWVIFVLWVSPGPVNPEFCFLPRETTQINPSKLASLLAGPTDEAGTSRPYESLIHLEYITDCTCEVDSNTATGTVSFKAEKVYEGKVGYTARKKDGKWRIEEFRLPDRKTTLTLGADDKWVKK